MRPGFLGDPDMMPRHAKRTKRRAHEFEKGFKKGWDKGKHKPWKKHGGRGLRKQIKRLERKIAKGKLDIARWENKLAQKRQQLATRGGGFGDWLMGFIA